MHVCPCPPQVSSPQRAPHLPIPSSRAQPQCTVHTCVNECPCESHTPEEKGHLEREAAGCCGLLRLRSLVAAGRQATVGPARFLHQSLRGRLPARDVGAQQLQAPPLACCRLLTSVLLQKDAVSGRYCVTTGAAPISTPFQRAEVGKLKTSSSWPPLQFRVWQ